jgi:hypothetical protein
LTTFISQLISEGLFLPILALRIIEENSASDIDLQTNFDLVDECGGKSEDAFDKNNYPTNNKHHSS